MCLCCSLPPLGPFPLSSSPVVILLIATRGGLTAASKGSAGSSRCSSRQTSCCQRISGTSRTRSRDLLLHHAASALRAHSVRSASPPVRGQRVVSWTSQWRPPRRPSTGCREPSKHQGAGGNGVLAVWWLSGGSVSFVSRFPLLSFCLACKKHDRSQWGDPKRLLTDADFYLDAMS